MRSLEAAILAELRIVAGNPKLRQKDIVAWQTGKDCKVEEGETGYYLPTMQVSCSVKVQPKAAKTGGSDK